MAAMQGGATRGKARSKENHTQVGTRKNGKAQDHAGYRGTYTLCRALQLN